MANICTNTMYVESETRENLDSIITFFNNNLKYYDYEDSGNSLDISFDSRWVFPEELMEELFEAIPNKSDIYMRCLSIEYGCMYHALWYCDEDGWHEC